MYHIRKKTLVNTDIKTVWRFISNPENLNKITPNEMDFLIISPVPDEMFNGLLIEYQIKIPFFGKRKWLTEIKHIVPMESFVDEQRIGPYQFWYHYHELQKVSNGVLIIDHITYSVPFGIIGKFLHKLLIRPLLSKIFAYRAVMFQKLLSSFSS